MPRSDIVDGPHSWKRGMDGGMDGEGGRVPGLANQTKHVFKGISSCLALALKSLGHKTSVVG